MKTRALLILAILVCQPLFAQKHIIELSYTTIADNSVTFNYKKTQPGTYAIKVDFLQISNCFTSVYKGKACSNSGQLFKLKPGDPSKPIPFTYKYSYIRGNPNPKVNRTFVYALPFAENSVVTVTEAKSLGETYLGQERPLNWKTYIVPRFAPDTVCCMRKGVVIEVINEYGNHENYDTLFSSKKNRVLIEHKDGTYASYCGFEKDKIFVKIGQTIYPRNKLGILTERKQGYYQLDFAVFYNKKIDYSKMGKPNEKPITNEYLTPLFITDSGEKKLVQGKDYKVKFSSELLQCEFSRREKKKYKKDPTIFN